MNLYNLFEGFLKEKVQDPEVRELVIAKLNDAVDVPFINEATEERALEVIYDIVSNIIIEKLLK
jgi:hypothetical protein